MKNRTLGVTQQHKCRRSVFGLYKLLFLCLFFVLPLSINANDYPGYAPVFTKLKKGVNQDCSIPSSANFDKLMHERGHMQAISEAGFTSVRFFIPYGAPDFTKYEQRIQDALDYNLAVVVGMWGQGWGDNAWHKNPSNGATQIANRWRTIATRWKDKYDNNVVFEILNEPTGIGFEKDSTGCANAMRLYNAATLAIREVDIDRPILIGCPGYNDAEFLSPYVTLQYLTYTYDNGKTFLDDPNMGVAIHFYSPSGHDPGYPNFAMWTASLGNSNWEATIDRHMDAVEDWKTAVDTDMPVVTTEWGCWLYDSRTNSQDLTDWLAYHLEQFESHNIGSMWYTAIHNNQRSFGIFNSETGWNPVVTAALTGETVPTSFPATSQLIDAEFVSWGSNTWKTFGTGVSKGAETANPLSGNSSAKITVTSGATGGISQQTLIGDEVYENVPHNKGRRLIHLIQGKTYEISFMAKAINGAGKVKVVLRDNSDSSLPLLHSTDEITVGTSTTMYSKYYTHSSSTEMDVRFEFDFCGEAQTVILDKVCLKQHGETANIEVSQTTQADVFIYPNPVNNLLCFQNDLDQNSDMNIEIFDLSGNVIKEKQLIAQHLDISDIIEGVYICRIHFNSEIRNIKFVKG